jgi:hypothetical protein
MFDKKKVREDYRYAAELGDVAAAQRLVNEFPTILAYIAKLERDLEKANIKLETAENELKAAARPKPKPKKANKPEVEDIDIPFD